MSRDLPICGEDEEDVVEDIRGIAGIILRNGHHKDNSQQKLKGEGRREWGVSEREAWRMDGVNSPLMRRRRRP